MCFWFTHQGPSSPLALFPGLSMSLMLGNTARAGKTQPLFRLIPAVLTVEIMTT